MGLQLPGHSIQLVVEPPSRSELYLAPDPVCIEISRHGCEYFIQCRVYIVEDGFGQFPAAFQAPQKSGQSMSLPCIPDRVETAIRAQKTMHARIIVSDRPEVKLLDPTLPRIFTAKMGKEFIAEISLLLLCGRLPCEYTVEQALDIAGWLLKIE